MNGTFERRLIDLEGRAAKRCRRTISHERRKELTDRAVRDGDQEALAILHGSPEQRAAAVAAGLRAAECDAQGDR